MAKDRVIFPIEFRCGEKYASDEAEFRKKCNSPRFVSMCIETYNRYRRGVGEYEFHEEPEKNLPAPMCPKALGIVLDSAAGMLKDYASIHEYHRKDRMSC